MSDLTVAELARRYGVARSTVARAIGRARNVPGAAPPEPLNPGERQLRYPVDEMDQWWPRRPDGRGQHRKDAR